jgi:uncharacterized protein
MPSNETIRPAVHMAASGILFDLTKHDLGFSVFLEDIVRSLSRVPRFNTQTTRFYSVAEHSMMVADIVREQEGSAMSVLQALLHDATEAYIGDVPAPVKSLIPEIRELEARLWYRVATAFNVPVPLSARVKEADWIALFIEAKALCPHADVERWDGWLAHGEAVERLLPDFRIGNGPFARLQSMPYFVERRFKRAIVKAAREARR